MDYAKKIEVEEINDKLDYDIKTLKVQVNNNGLMLEKILESINKQIQESQKVMDQFNNNFNKLTINIYKMDKKVSELSESVDKLNKKLEK